MNSYKVIEAGKDQNGKTIVLGTMSGKLIEQGGLKFKDLAGTGELLPYEDWRLTDEARARDLAGRLSIEEIAGLMLYSAHQCVPASMQGPFIGHYDGKSLAESGAEPFALTDEQKKFLESDHIRHVLLAILDTPAHAAAWNNELQKKAESLPFGIPVNISSDPRHGESFAGAEFKSAGSGVSIWPEGVGMTALHSIETVKEFAKTAAVEYRAMGITTALWPQVDLATEPRWMRLEDTPGTDLANSIAMAKAYCDGLQTTEGEADGWGNESVIAMAKHWPGGGTGEGGRDAHYAFGCFAVYPNNRFREHLRVFTEGAFNLEGATGKAAAVMPYYTVSWGVDEKNHENVGNSYSEYIIHDLLREKYGYDGVVCTDWGITQDPADTIEGFGSRCYGMEKRTEAERHLRIIMNGVDQFGGNNLMQPVVDAYHIGSREYGETFMRARYEESAVRLLRNMFRLGLFENPYVDPQRAAEIVGCSAFRAKGKAAQAESVVLLKNKGNVLPLGKGVKIWCPERKIAERMGFMRFMSPEKKFMPLQPSDMPDYMELTDDPNQADCALVFMDSPLTDNGYSSTDLQNGGNGYIPISLQYRPYTANAARKVSIAGGDFREKFTNRSYYGKTAYTANEQDLDNVITAREKMKDKPVIALVNLHNPCVMAEFEPYCDVILTEFGTQRDVLLGILTGELQAGGVLPYHLPKDMDTIERHAEDTPDDYVPYTDTEGNTYARGYAKK